MLTKQNIKTTIFVLFIVTSFI